MTLCDVGGVGLEVGVPSNHLRLNVMLKQKRYL